MFLKELVDSIDGGDSPGTLVVAVNAYNQRAEEQGWLLAEDWDDILGMQEATLSRRPSPRKANLRAAMAAKPKPSPGRKRYRNRRMLRVCGSC